MDSYQTYMIRFWTPLPYFQGPNSYRIYLESRVSVNSYTSLHRDRERERERERNLRVSRYTQLFGNVHLYAIFLFLEGKLR